MTEIKENRFLMQREFHFAKDNVVRIIQRILTHFVRGKYHCIGVDLFPFDQTSKAVANST